MSTGGLLAAERFFAAVGALFVRIYAPQCRTDRRAYVRETAVWAASGLVVYELLMLSADSPSVPDEVIAALARALPWLMQCWWAALLAIAARRCHDLGLSGGWALLTQVPVLGELVIIAGALLPSRPEGRFWPRAGGVGASPERL